MQRIIQSLIVLIISCLIVSCNSAPPSVDTPRIEIKRDGITTFREGFEHPPAAWEFAAGEWQKRGSEGAGVLTQTSTDRDFPVALLKWQRFSDVDIQVRFKPISGIRDASGGIIFRARDGRNYYVVRANSLEDNFRLYTVINGDRTKIASTRIKAPSFGEWHTLRVIAVGPRIQAYLDGHLLIDHHDGTFQSGYVGLWTKADSVTEFDDLEVRGISVNTNSLSGNNMRVSN